MRFRHFQCRKSQSIKSKLPRYVPRQPSTPPYVGFLFRYSPDPVLTPITIFSVMKIMAHGKPLIQQCFPRRARTTARPKRPGINM